jgi:hypothetical protein
LPGDDHVERLPENRRYGLRMKERRRPRAW